MKVFLPEKYHSLKGRILNSIGAHPRLITLLAGLGISFTFSYVGKIAIHEVLQPVYAIPPALCIACASEFAPGQEAEFPGDAADFAPGQIDKSPGDAQDLAPGHLKEKTIELSGEEDSQELSSNNGDGDNDNDNDNDNK